MKVLCAMSGGVDSSAAAYLLHQQGHEVIGVFMRNGIDVHRSNQKSCCSVEDAYDARRVADFLGIPFYSLNLKDGFQTIIDYFVQEYEQGRTPNPCVMCNRTLKFGALFDYADALGAQAVATGHYARALRENGRTRLLRGVDPSKDQSYVLATLTPTQLDRVVFPIGDLAKAQVRTLAEQAGLRTFDKPDSQEICFVPDGDYRKLLGNVHPGPLKTADGRTVGEHGGHQLYTIGQRKGIGAHGRRTYVVGIDASANTVIVGDDLRSSTMRVDRLNRLADTGRAFRADVKIRHQHTAAPSSVEVLSDGTAQVAFDEPQRAIAPGQLAAFYREDEVIGGGWITCAGNAPELPSSEKSPTSL